MKILVTGATGFIGRSFSQRLMDNGHQVICAGRSLRKIEVFKDRAKLIHLDIQDAAEVGRILKQERPELLYHCAALVENGDLAKLRRVNVDGTRNVLDACLQAGVKKAVYLSSVAAVSANEQVPLTDDMPRRSHFPYGFSKVEAEEVAEEFRKRGLKIAILRPCMVYGEDEPHLLSLLVRLIRWRLLPVLGPGDKKIHLVSLHNVVDVMMLCVDNDKAYDGTFLIADEEALTIDEFFNIIADATGAKRPFHLPERSIPLLTSIPFIGPKVRFFLKDRIYSIDRIKTILGYHPRIKVCDGLPEAALSCLRD